MKKIPIAKKINPLLAFSLTWGTVFVLYSLNLSTLQIYTNHEVLSCILIFFLPFSLSFLLGYFFNKKPKQECVSVNYKSLNQRSKILLLLFIAIISVEVLIESYIPIISMIKGSNISHFSFGLSGLHGLALALGTLTATIFFYLYLVSNQKRHLIGVLLCIFIFALLVTRKMIVLTLIQCVLLYIIIKGLPSRRRIAISLTGIFITILVFGWIGDIRTGREVFLSLSRPSFDYPTWLPSGFMWIYIYAVTPILTFTNAVNISIQTSQDLQFACGLLPSFLRESIGCSVRLGFDFEEQLSGAFNVATGYISLYRSWGEYGVIIFSLIHGALASYFYFSNIKDSKRIIIYSVFLQSTVVMIFSNGFLNLNVLGQFIIMPLAFIGSKKIFVFNKSN